jgi:hypothetical protein
MNYFSHVIRVKLSSGRLMGYSLELVCIRHSYESLLKKDFSNYLELN